MIIYSPEERTAENSETGETIPFYCGPELTPEANAILWAYFYPEDATPQITYDRIIHEGLIGRIDTILKHI